MELLELQKWISWLVDYNVMDMFRRRDNENILNLDGSCFKVQEIGQQKKSHPKKT